MEGIVFGESPRWRDGKIWFSDWGAHHVVVVDPSGDSEVVLTVPSFPMCIDFLPDGRLLVVDSARRRVLRREADGSLSRHADLRTIADKPWNEIVVDAGGAVYVNTIGFDFPDGDPAPGAIAHIAADGQVRAVAADLAFPNGMALTEDGATLIVAESHANRLTAFDVAADGGLANRRVWAATPDDHPDGVCLDAEGAVWYADVANCRCVRIREGGDITHTVTLDRGAFSCTLSRTGEPTLYVVAQEYGGESTKATGQLLAFAAPALGAGRP